MFLLKQYIYTACKIFTSCTVVNSSTPSHKQCYSTYSSMFIYCPIAMNRRSDQSIRMVVPLYDSQSAAANQGTQYKATGLWRITFCERLRK